MLNYPFNPQIIKGFNPQTRYNIFSEYTGRTPSARDINNFNLLSSYARNLVRERQPEAYQELQNYLYRIYGR